MLHCSLGFGLLKSPQHVPSQGSWRGYGGGVAKSRQGRLCLSPWPGLPLTDGLEVFQAFLRTEFSEENLEFWLACEDFKKVKSQSKMAAKAKKIFAEYIAIQACKEVRLLARTLGPQSPWPKSLSAARRQPAAQEGKRPERL